MLLLSVSLSFSLMLLMSVSVSLSLSLSLMLLLGLSSCREVRPAVLSQSGGSVRAAGPPAEETREPVAGHPPAQREDRPRVGGARRHTAVAQAFHHPCSLYS